jgi:hypothetical protein
MLLCADGRLDDKSVEGVRNQGNSKVNLLEGLVQSGGIVHIEGDSLGVGETFAELLSALEGSASCNRRKEPLSVYASQNSMSGIHPSGFSSTATGTVGIMKGVCNSQVRKELYEHCVYVPTVTCTSALLRTSTVGLVTTSLSAKKVQCECGAPCLRSN